LFHHALFQDRPVGIGMLVADLDSLVFELADEVVALRFFLELMRVFTGTIFFHEIAITKRGLEAGSLRNGGNLAAKYDALNGWPALCDLFVAALAPSAPIDGTPAEEQIESSANPIRPEVCVRRGHEPEAITSGAAVWFAG
jgi:hypothetical protein